MPNKGEIWAPLTYLLHSKSHLVNVVDLLQGHTNISCENILLLTEIKLPMTLSIRLATAKLLFGQYILNFIIRPLLL